TLLSVVAASLLIAWFFQRFPVSVSHPLAALVPAIGVVGNGIPRSSSATSSSRVSLLTLPSPLAGGEETGPTGFVGNDPRASGSARKLTCVVALMILSVLLVRLWVATKNQAEATEAMSNHLVKAIEDLRPRPDELYVDWGGNFPYELLLGARQIQALL